MPSFTFVSTANAFALLGGKPVFVDINPNTQCIGSKEIEKAITKKTKAIVLVHYAGFGYDLEKIKDLCQTKNIVMIEDAAQTIGSKYDGVPLGFIGDFGTLSFHETKNISSGEGGALIINNQDY